MIEIGSRVKVNYYGMKGYVFDITESVPGGLKYYWIDFDNGTSEVYSEKETTEIGE